MISNFGSMIESFSDLPDDKKMELMNFIALFNHYIEHASDNYKELNGFYSYMATRTNNIIADYKASMGMDWIMSYELWMFYAKITTNNSVVLKIEDFLRY